MRRLVLGDCLDSVDDQIGDHPAKKLVVTHDGNFIRKGIILEIEPNAFVVFEKIQNLNHDTFEIHQLIFRKRHFGECRK